MRVEVRVEGGAGGSSKQERKEKEEGREKRRRRRGRIERGSMEESRMRRGVHHSTRDSSRSRARRNTIDHTGKAVLLLSSIAALPPAAVPPPDAALPPAAPPPLACPSLACLAGSGILPLSCSRTCPKIACLMAIGSTV